MAADNKKLRDSDAKGILSTSWPTSTRLLSGSEKGRLWIRAQPKLGKVVCPRLVWPGQRNWKTQPDGMYVSILGDELFCDALVIEVCGSMQNFNDKRSRYAPTTGSILLKTEENWEKIEINIKKSKRSISSIFQIKNHIGSYPVRHLRALFVLPNDVYRDVRDNLCPMGHEYYMRHSSLATVNSKSTREFLKRMSKESHFLASQR